MSNRNAWGIVGVGFICFVLVFFLQRGGTAYYPSQSSVEVRPASSTFGLRSQPAEASQPAKELQETEYEVFSEEVVGATPLEQENTAVEPLPPAPEMSIEDLLDLKASVHGFHNKSGMLDPVQWMGKFAADRKTEVEKWFVHAMSQNSSQEPIQPPVQWPECSVHVNHHYKFIWIKGTKVGGTALRSKLAWICGDSWMAAGANYDYCSKPLFQDKALSVEKAKELWKDYFVFGIIRNPYARFGSSYTYMSTMIGNAPAPSFKSVCQDPFLMAKTCTVSHCPLGDAVERHVHHIMEQAPCFFTEDGKMAVDYVGETDTLSEDYKVIAREANKRRREGVPPLDEEISMGHENANPKSNYTVDFFKTYPGCIDDIRRNFRTDFERLGYAEMR